MNPRLVVIALDAADSQLLRQWSSRGYLPTLSRLMESGITAPVATPPAVLEGAVWPTLTTGCLPGTHGMFSYYQLKPGTYKEELGLRADRMPVAPFWVSLSEAGKRLAIIDAPFSIPHQGLNGIQIVNWGAHDRWSWDSSSWPDHLLHDVTNRFGLHPVPLCDARGRTPTDYEDLKIRLLDGVRKKSALLRYCLSLEPWDFLFGVFSESHCVGHQCWHLLDSTHPRHDPIAHAALTGTILEVYRAIDRAIGELVNDLPSNVHVIVMSSHGMGPYYTGSHLLKEILDRLAVNDGVKASGGPDLKQEMWDLRRFLPDKARRLLKAWCPRALGTLWSCFHPLSDERRQMRAFKFPSNDMTSAIRINLKGRDPDGCVEPGRDYEALCAELTDALLALQNPDTGQSAVQWVRRSAELFQGPRLHELPDVFIEWEHSVPINALCSPKTGTVTGVYRSERTGNHRAGGLLIGSGPEFGAGSLDAVIRTVDIAPTILDFFGVAAPAHFEGRTVLDAMRKVRSRPPEESPLAAVS